MIISASYRTDIPTFYGEWFRKRLAAGNCVVPNPYNRAASRVPLIGRSVDGYVFWTKNIAPFLPVLEDVAKTGKPFLVQHTITGYPHELEKAVAPTERSVAHVHEVARRFGLASTVWRYDPIVLSSETPAEYHRRNFKSLAASLEGAVDEVVVSFVQMYKKTKANFAKATEATDVTWQDPDSAWKMGFIEELTQVAKPHGIQLTVCTQPDLLPPSAGVARCIDADRLTRISGIPLGTKIKGNRPDCACFESRDIGAYDTCPHGCVYCYAVQNRELALTRFKMHDPDSEFLFEPEGGVSKIFEADEKSDVDPHVQLPLIASQ